MLFNSIEFAVFFPIVTILFFLIPHRFRWFFLVVCSCIFYMSYVPKYILILFAMILIDYWAGMAIEAAQGPKRKHILFISLFMNLGILGFFKYFDFANSNITEVGSWFGWHNPIPYLNIILPIGLSFHTFQSLSYTIEVYLGKQKAERHLGIYALYVLFYPQLVAGPIERPQNLLHQFREEKLFDARRVKDGLLLMFAGLFKKMVIADRAAVLVNQVFENHQSYSGASLWLGCYFFSIQVYCDFSGYSDIARGAAQVMGYDLMENFQTPYAARNIGEFWRRWHISLFSWFRSYVFTPIAYSGSRTLNRTYLAVFFVFLASGIWHGARWTFIIWGVIHGIYSYCSPMLKPMREKVGAALEIKRFPTVLATWQVFCTFHLVTFSWIFFRANTVKESWEILRRIVFHFDLSALTTQDLGLNGNEILLVLCAMLALETVQYFQRHRNLRLWIGTMPTYQRWAIYYAVVGAIIVLGDVKPQEFIYFQF